MNEAITLDQLTNLPLEEKRDWYIPESLSTAYPIQDIGEPLVGLESLARNKGVAIVLEPVSPIDNPDLHLRSTVANKLISVASRLLEDSLGGVTLKVTDAFRPLSLQRKYFAEISEQIIRKENLRGQALWNRVTQFIADPDLCPPHSTGGAVDCTLVRTDNNIELSMGVPVDTISSLSRTWNKEVVGEARANRLKLYLVMTEFGFVNLPTEWWHYSFGDQYWAAYSQRSTALYGSLERISSE